MESPSRVDVKSAASAQEGAVSATTAAAGREIAQEDTPVAAESASAAEAEVAEAPEAAESEAVEEPAADVRAYALNKNSRKFHFPSCSSVGDIKDSNRWDVEMTRDAVVSMGYEPCKRCNP